jgi:ABC-2 type transport system permease protein
MASSSRWRAEWRLFASERTPWLLVLLFGAIMAYGAWNGATWARFQREAVASLTTADSTRLDALAQSLQRRAAGDTTVRVPPAGALGATGATRHAVLPQSALAPLAVGASDLYPYYARVSVRSKQSFMTSEEVENPHNLLAGRFDLVFVIVYILPLFLLALTYNVVSAEREQGTMALWLSQPVVARRLLLTKLLVRVGFVLAVVLCFTGVLAVLTGVPVGRADALAALGLWMATVVAYAAFWVALAVAVNARGLSSATNAVLLLGAWLLVVVVIPSTVAAVVSAVHPAPSRVALTTALREAGDRAAAQGDTAVNQFLADHPEMLRTGTLAASNAWGRTLALQERTNDAMRATYSAFDSALVAQHRAADLASVLSPAIMVQEALHEVAGRGIGRFRAFDAQIDTLHRAWQQFFFQRVFGEQPFTAADFANLPRFQFVERGVADRARVIAPWLSAILLPTLLLGALGVRRLARVELQR